MCVIVLMVCESLWISFLDVKIQILFFFFEIKNAPGVCYEITEMCHFNSAERRSCFATTENTMFIFPLENEKLEF